MRPWNVISFSGHIKNTGVPDSYRPSSIELVGVESNTIIDVGVRSFPIKYWNDSF